jgi:UDP-GlcNAc:undecaprenyl-phosphate GlcNAc-1-phosphate transferase
VEFVLAALVAVVVTPVAATVARRTGVVDRPGELKTHTRPVPYLGGVAVFAALAVGVVAVGRYEYFAPLGLALVLGVTDDVRPLPPGLRLALELVIAVVAGLVAPGPGLVRLAVAMSVVVLMNAVNLLDGQDGLAGSVGLVAAVGLAWLGGDAQPYSLALAGALAGFLVFNRPPARIYLGDGGAYLLGTALALALPLTDPGGSAWALWFAAPLLVGLPLLDTAVAIWRRLASHRPLFTGDRSHLYDQLVDRGLGVGASTATCAGLQVVFSALGVVAAGLGSPTALAVTVGTAAAAAVVAVRADFV